MKLLAVVSTVSLLAIACASSLPSQSANPAASPSGSPTATAAVEPAPIHTLAKPIDLAATPAEAPASDSASTRSAEETLIAMGQFVDGEHPTRGTAQVVTENGLSYVELGEDFQTDRGPDLFVILHRSDDVIGTTQPPAHAIQEADYLSLAPLQATTGEQRYAIPATVNLADFQSVAIWCRRFNATFGAASLQR